MCAIQIFMWKVFVCLSLMQYSSIVQCTKHSNFLLFFSSLPPSLFPPSLFSRCIIKHLYCHCSAVQVLGSRREGHRHELLDTATAHKVRGWFFDFLLSLSPTSSVHLSLSLSVSPSLLVFPTYFKAVIQYLSETRDHLYSLCSGALDLGSRCEGHSASSSDGRYVIDSLTFFSHSLPLFL